MNLTSQPGKPDFHKTILDAVPIPIFIVDPDMRIIEYNSAASVMLQAKRKQTIRRKTGDAFHCIHATKAEHGCGTAPICGDCIIRNSVKKSLEGEKILKQKTRVEIVQCHGPIDIDLLITTAPFEYNGGKLVMLSLEDISELNSLREIIPMCANCKKIRDDKSYWDSVEGYFSKYLGIDFSHGICPECIEKLYPGFHSTIQKPKP